MAGNMEILTGETGESKEHLSACLAAAAAQKTKEKAYWMNKLAGNPGKTVFPYDNKKIGPGVGESGQTYAEEEFRLPVEVFTRLKEMSGESDRRLHMILVAALAALLMRYTRSHDIIIWTTVIKPGKTVEESKLINTVLALRNQVEERMTFKELILRVKQVVREAEENRNYPVEILLQQLDITGKEEGSPLYGNAVVVESIHDRRYFRAIKPEMVLGFTGNPGKGEGTWYYQPHLYKKTTVRRIIAHYIALMSEALEKVDAELRDLEILSPAEKRQILGEFNSTRAGINREKCYHQVFEEQVAKNPDSKAAVHNFEQISYRALDEEAGATAGYLEEKGAAANHLVAIYMKRGQAMLASIIGILKLGSAYLAIEADYPPERVVHILRDSSVRILITAGENYALALELKEKYRLTHIQAIHTPDRGKSAAPTHTRGGKKQTHRGIHISPGNIAYVIYTSGTTGRPKGVMIHQLGMLNHIYANTGYLALTGRDIIAQTASTGFDISVWQFLTALTLGGVTHIIDQEKVTEPQRLVGELGRGKVTVLEIVPSSMSVLLEQTEQGHRRQLKYLRWLIPTGEALSVSLAREWYRQYPQVKLVNAYGPAEASDDVTLWCVEPANLEKQETIPIGKPLPNIHIYIMEPNLRICPVHVEGEICVSGIGVGKGYMNDPGKTAGVFEMNPYRREIGGSDYTVLYRTGDMGYYTGEGNIEFLGRRDHQVKIRGQRIELEEIRERLKMMEEVKDAVVIARESRTGEKYLCGYVVPEAGREVSALELRERLTGYLPAYMVPAYMVMMEKIPLTPNGKIDRKKLPEPVNEQGDEYIAPRDEIEKKLVDIWAEVLNQEKESIGITADFFRVGGHSLKATVLVSKIHKVFDVKYPLAEVFKKPVIREMAGYIKERAKEYYQSIEPVEEKEYYPLSSAQKRLYILQQMDPGSTAYNMPEVIPLPAAFDLRKVDDIFKKLIKRHESLRTSFHMVNDTPVQVIHEEVEFKIEYYNLVRVIHEKAELEIENDRSKDEGRWSLENCQGRGEVPSPIKVEKIIGNFIRPFELSSAPLLRVGLIKEADQKHILMVDQHHIVSDGVSQEILLRDFREINAGGEIPPLRIRYKDYSEWQNSDKEKKNLKRREEYWIKEYEGEIPVLEIPADNPRPAIRSFEGDSEEFEMTEAETRGIKAMALETGNTLYMVLAAAVNVLLSKLSGQEEIIIGTPAAGRRHENLEQVIGMFVNTLVLRNYPAGERIFSEFLGEVKEKALMAFENQEYPFEELVEKLSVKRDTGRNPVFDVMFALQNINGDPVGREAGTGAEIGNKPVYRTSKFDLAINVEERDRGLFFAIEYYTKLYRKETIRRYVVYLRKIVSTVVEKPGIKLREIEIIPGEEKKQLLENFNDTAVPYPKEKTIHRLYEEQVEQKPDQVVLVSDHSNQSDRSNQSNRSDQSDMSDQFYRSYRSYISITYRELNERSARMAHLLIEKGVCTDTIVGIKVERSLEMIIGLLGILKAGGAYLPIDPEYPEERVNYMLADSGARVLFSMPPAARGSFEKPPLDPTKLLFKGSIVDCRLLMSSSDTLFHHSSFIIHHPGNLAYIIYTSGTTGGPKGVGVEHRNVVRLVKNAGYIQYTEQDRLLPTGSVAFDISTFEIWGPLLNRAAIVLEAKEVILDPGSLESVIKKNGITIMHLIPQLFSQLEEQEKGIFAGLRYFLVGGDMVKPGAVNRLRAAYPGLEILHCYGPTEGTTFTTIYRVEKDNEVRIPIGKPIANTGVCIVDKYGQMQPQGIPGELVVGGDGVARGYLNNPELTGEKFDQDLWDNQDYQKFFRGSRGAILQKSPHGRRRQKFYKTGDLARWLPDPAAQGAYMIEFLGRIDGQVKIRGYRVEMGEIENRLLKYPGIKEAVVMAREETKGDKYICAYIVSGSKNEITGLREFLAEELPGYMIPAHYVRLEKIPLTSNGKVDRGALPGPGQQEAGHFIAPRDKTEAKLVEIWAEVLSLEKERISITGNFFTMGGHSLKAAVMIAKIQKEFQVKLPLAQVFQTPRIEGLAAIIKNLRKEKYISIEPVEKREYYGLSSAQKRLYFLQAMELRSTAYNIPMTLSLEGEINSRSLENTFRQSIKRHESLRTSFRMVKDTPVQVIHEKAELEIENDPSKEEGRWSLENGQGRGEVPSPTPIEKIIGNFIRPFELSKAPLMRVGLIKEEHRKHILIVDLHHIIADGTSTGLLIKEAMELYAGEKLPPLKLQYKDYAQWQNSEPQKKAIKEQEEYWRKQFEGEVPVLNLPLDYTRPAVQSFEGATLSFEMPGETARALNRLALETGATLNIVLLAIYNIFLSKLSGQEEIVVGIPVAARRHADLEPVIGMFVNTLALRNYPEGSKKFIDFLSEMREKNLEAYENQEYQFEELVEKVLTHREIDRNPLFDTLMVLQNMEIQSAENLTKGLSSMTIKPYEIETGISKFDLELTLNEADGKLVGSWGYCTRLFKKETVRRLAKYFLQVVLAVKEGSDKRLSQIEIITEEEKRQVLEDFNDTALPYPKEKTIHRLYEEQVEQKPDQVALLGTKLQITKYKLQTNSKLQITNNKQSGALRARVDSFGGSAASGDDAALDVGLVQPVRPVGPVPPVPPVQLTYRELNERSARMAHLLIEKGVCTDTIVGIKVERSVEMIIGLLGILKAGGVYLPIDPGYPQERIEYMLKDSGAPILLTAPTLEEAINRSYTSHMSYTSPGNLPTSCSPNFLTSQLPSFSLLPAAGHRPPETAVTPSTSTLTCQVSPANLAYVIYTSGTTGKPKGVMIEAASVVKLVKNPNYIKFTEGERLLNTGSIGFDIATFEIWGPLLNGISLYLADGSTITEAKRLKEYITVHRITLLHLIPQLYNQMAAEDIGIFAGLKYFLVGGDKVSPFYINRLREKNRGLTILHMYGPTEGTTFSTFLPVEGIYEERIPIGKPVSNTIVYILGKGGEMLPIGAVGELVIGGEGIARGYLNNPELTGEKFDQDLWDNQDYQKFFRGSRGAILQKSPHGRRRQKFYKTGDLARWLTDGNIEFLGRIDSQVKLRGIRIELGEIENRVLAHPGVKEVVVQVLPGGRGAESGEKDLCAYITAEKEIPVSEMRETLTKGLPGYMIPAYFVFLERIPLTANGKVDRRALPLPGVKAGAVYTAPRSEIEKKLTAIWIEILARDAQQVSQLEASLGIDDNFFEMGGHSLKAAGVISRVNNEFKVDVPLVELFKNPNIRKMAEYIRQAGSKGFTAPSKDNRDKDKNLVLLRESPGAKGNLFFFHDGSGEVEGYIEFCAHLEVGYNYWGIRANRLENYTPRNLSIEEMAAGYIEKMKARRLRGPYRLAGWSLGGLIAFEIALQLEKVGEAVSFLGMIDVPPPSPNYKESREEFGRENEIQWIKEYLPGEKIEEKLGQVAQIHEIWPALVNHLEENSIDIEIIKRIIPGPLAQIIPNYDRLTIKELIYYLNVDRTFRRARVCYVPSDKVRIPLHYIKAGESRPGYRDRWQDYCIKPIKSFEIPGDHFSILKSPGVYQMIKIFEKILKE